MRPVIVVMSDSLSGDHKQAAAGAAGPATVRLDVWLWAVRLFKTRTAAAEACRLSRVTSVDGAPMKPSRAVRAGDELCLHEDFLVRRVRVDRVLERRVGAPVAAVHRTELTPAADLERARTLRAEQRLATPVFVPGAGRPTKAQRRALEAWHRAARGEGAGGEADDDQEAE